MATLFMESCDNENIDSFSTFYWNQTKCADPWGTGQNDSNLNTSSALKEFLEEKGINVLKISFEDISNGDLTCDSCGCTTGIRIFVNIAEKDKDKLKKLGFEKLS